MIEINATSIPRRDENFDPRTATPCRTAIFAGNDLIVEANYLGFITVRNTSDGTVVSRFLGQTALVETLRYHPDSKCLIVVGAGFEGYRDFGVVKVLSFPDGNRIAELHGHTDDVTDAAFFPTKASLVATIGLDRRLVVHDIRARAQEWSWEGYEDYLNMCAVRPSRDTQIALAGDSPYTYVVDRLSRVAVAKLSTPGDSNGLIWSRDGRFLIVGDDRGVLKYFDSDRDWKLVKEVLLGAAVKRTVSDPKTEGQWAIAACYDGQMWGFPLDAASLEAPRIIAPRRRGMWGINVDATSTHLVTPSFHDRAFLFGRTAHGDVGELVGAPPTATFGANWIQTTPCGTFILTSHDDGHLRLRSASDGRLAKVFAGDSDSLLMGFSIHPNGNVVACIDFYGEVWLYSLRDFSLIQRLMLPFGPGITLAFSDNGAYLAAGGYRSDAYVLNYVDGATFPLSISQELDSPTGGVVKNISFSRGNQIVSARGDGSVVRHRLVSGHWVLVNTLRGSPSMELCNGAASSRVTDDIFVVSRDQTVRRFRSETGQEMSMGLGHTRSVKCIIAIDDRSVVVTGSYDRSILVWDMDTLKPILPPMRLSNSGVSGLAVKGEKIFSCSFDGVVAAWHIDSGRLLWYKDAENHALNT